METYNVVGKIHVLFDKRISHSLLRNDSIGVAPCLNHSDNKPGVRKEISVFSSSFQ